VYYAPEVVYRHRSRGWKYVPIHPFGDEPHVLARLGLRPEDCHSADAWWGVDGDATLLESSIVGIRKGPPRLFAKATPHVERWVYLVAILDAPFVTRTAFEAAMVRFADAGFPNHRRFQLREGDPPVPLGNEELLRIIIELAREYPDVKWESRTLSGTRSMGDKLVLERQLGDVVRVVRIPVTSELVRTFYWGELPHGEGNVYGDLAYVRTFVKRFLFELEDWRSIARG
jgi:hypothetical protein